MNKTLVFIYIITVLGLVISLPQTLTVKVPWKIPYVPEQFDLHAPVINFKLGDKQIYKTFEFKQGLDIQGGMQVVLQADVSELRSEDRTMALQSAREIILRRVDMYGISEPTVQTAISGDDYRLLVSLPGVSDPQEALSLVGRTAQLDFRLIKATDVGADQETTGSAGGGGTGDDNQGADVVGEGTGKASQGSKKSETPGDEGQPNPLPQGSLGIVPTGLTGQQLNKASVQFDPNTNEPVILLEFNETGREMFKQITTDNVGEMLAIVIDDNILMAPVIKQPISDGMATITGGFTLDDAKLLSTQLNAGALPVPIEVLEQRTVGASLGQAYIRESVEAGIIGLGLVMLFMIIYYGYKGVLASLALLVYAILTSAVYKIFGVVLTLPGIAGLLLSIGMAVDSNILIFERMKEEERVGKPFKQAMELGFGRAWDSIKDANLVTILTALVLINPLNFNFLNTSGLVRGFGITLLVGVLLSLFTGVVVTRNLMRAFLKEPKNAKGGQK